MELTDGGRGRTKWWIMKMPGRPRKAWEGSLPSEEKKEAQ